MPVLRISVGFLKGDTDLVQSENNFLLSMVKLRTFFFNQADHQANKPRHPNVMKIKDAFNATFS